MTEVGGVRLSLIPLARALGGECYAGGTRALVPAPGHGAADRSVSLRLVGGRLLVHSFGAAGWREVLDDLRTRGWIDAENRLLEGAAPVADRIADAPDRTRADRIASAQRLWDGAGPIIPGCAAQLHAARRGVDLGAAGGDALRAHAAAPSSAYRDRGPWRPALLACVRDADGRLVAVEITYLTPSGRRCANMRAPRKVIGVLPAGCAVRLAAVGSTLVVGEGVFTTLSAMRRLGFPGWALLSTSNLRRWSPPASVHHVVIAGDHGPDGERSARLLQARLSEAGAFAELAFPPAGYGDWNDLDQEEVEEGRVGAPGS